MGIGDRVIFQKKFSSANNVLPAVELKIRRVGCIVIKGILGLIVNFVILRQFYGILII